MLATAGTAGAATPTSNGGSRVVGVPSGRCLDVIGGSITPGTRVQLWGCLGDPQQAWVYSGGRLEVYGNDTLCLDATSQDGGRNGTPIQVWTCNGRANQEWVAEPDGALKSVAYGRCLDAVNGGQGNGTRLQLWNCLGDPQQDWVGPPIPNGGGPIKGLGSGRCLDVTNASISPGARPQLWDCLGDAQQQWQLNGRELQVYADKCLDVTNNRETPGAPVQIWYCLGDPQQQWSWGADGTIRSLSSGLCLDPAGGATANGTRLELSKCDGSPGESWSRGTPPSPVPTPPPVSAPVTTPVPIPKAPHALKVRMALTWRWEGKTTWLLKTTIGRMPWRTRISLRCTGRGCPRHSRLSVRGARAVRRLVRSFHRRRYRSGDVLRITLTAPGYRPERARVMIRNGRKPLVR